MLSVRFPSAVVRSLPAGAAVLVLCGPAAAAHPLVPGIFPTEDVAARTTVARIHAAGARVVRLRLPWDAVAPKTRRDGFHAADPADSAYSWGAIDGKVVAAVRAGLEPIVDIYNAPSWAQQPWPKQYIFGATRPSVRQLALFARAAALRYGGDFAGLPRVRDWMLWDEPNLLPWLRPQLEHGRPASPVVYRGMLNAFADAVHGVHADNVVIAGGTAPFTSADGTTPGTEGVAPLAFLRTLLCLDRKLHPACSARAKFDVWAHHPYTSGGPRHHATYRDDVSLGDLPEMKAVLDAGVRARKILSRHRPRFWVTEFSWDTNPPDPDGVPLALQTRWVSEAMYKMWRSGVSLVVWFTLTDDPYPVDWFQSGLYFVNGKAKPTLNAFRFPFVAQRDGARLRLWARTPLGRAGRVVVERHAGGWRRFAVLRADRYGIVNATTTFRSGVYRARFAGERSLPFSTTEPPDRYFRPFGSIP